MANDGTTTSGTATYDPDDYFAQAVTNFTGYALPARSTIFDTLSSDSGDDFHDLKLFRMDIQNMSMRSVTKDDYSAIGGWQVNSGEDYDVAFYDAGGDGAHSSVSMKKARIVMIGVLVDSNGRATLWGDGQISSGGKFEGSYSHVQWDLGPMAQYISGSKMALDQLVNNHTTVGYSYSGLSVSDANAVDLASFENTGQSFDRVLQFFKDHSDTVNKWMTSLGEDQASWKGKAASLFWHLLDELKTNYEGYVSQLGGREYTATNSTLGGYVPKSKLSDALAAAQKALVDGATSMQTAWTEWAKEGHHDPHYHVQQILNSVTKFIIENNINHVNKSTSTNTGYQGNSYTTTTYSTDASFKQTSDYGDLTQLTTWQAIADAAVKSWQDHADATLKQPAITAISNVKSAWADVEDAFDTEIVNKNSETLAEVYQEEENDIAEDEANKNSDDLNNALNNLNDGLNNMGDDFDDLNTDLNDSLNNIGDNFDDLNTDLNDSLNNIGDNFDDLNTGLNDSLNNIGDDLSSSLNNVGDDLSSSLNGLGNTDLNTDSLLNGDGTTVDPSLLTNGLLNTNGLTSGDSESSLNSPTGASTQLNGDGTLTTTYPDGSTQTINPATGLVTTTSPDGTSTVSQLNPGTTITNPDGSTTTLNDDGTLTTDYPDGSSQTLDPSTGQVTTINPDGTVTSSTLNPTQGSFTTPDGNTAQLNSDGSLTTSYGDGSTETLNPDTGQVTVTSPDGTVTTTHLDPGQSFTNPDGSTTTLNSDGTLTTKFPDGSTQTLNPDTGELSTTDPSGHTTTTDIDGTGLSSSSINTDGLDTTGLDTSSLDTSGLNSPSSLDLSSSSGLNGGGGLSTSSLNSGDGTTGSGLSGEYDDYDSNAYSGGSLRAGVDDDATSAALNDTSATDSSDASGTPLNPYGMGGMGGGMGGMGGGGGGGGGQGGTTERTRAVLTDPAGTSSRRNRTTRGAAVEEDEDVVYTRPTTSSSPYPVGGAGNGSGQDGRSTESGDRAREAWLAEDEDVWGTDEGGAPAVIGR